MVNREIIETLSITDGDKRIFLQDDLALLDLPGGEESPPLASRLPDDVGRAGGLVSLPVLGLAILAAVGNVPTDTALQRLLGDDLAEAARCHLALNSF